MIDSIVEPEALVLSDGKFGTTFNGQTFQVEALTTLNGWQYATYVEHRGHVGVARRRLPAAEWERVVFEDYVIDHNDVHNVPVIGISPLDGTIHLAFDHHNSPLHYRVSGPAAATSPETADWSAALFGPIIAELTAGTELRELTYPNFVNAPDGTLQLYFRLGRSGNGDNHFAEYRPGGWMIVGEFVSRHGQFVDSDCRSAYHNGYDFDGSGRLHTSWVWRESLNLQSNHDLQYACSDDRGRTWLNSAGAEIGVTGEDPLQLETPGITVSTIPFGWGVMNQVTQTVDQSGRLHVIMWQQPPTAPRWSADLNTWRYVHYRRETDGTWHRQVLPFHGRKPSVLARGDDLVIVSTKPADLDYHWAEVGGPLQVYSASSADGWSTWREVYRSPQSFIGEPRLDRHRWQTSEVLSVYAQESPTGPGVPSPLHVIDFDHIS